MFGPEGNDPNNPSKSPSILSKNDVKDTKKLCNDYDNLNQKYEQELGYKSTEQSEIFAKTLQKYRRRQSAKNFKIKKRREKQKAINMVKTSTENGFKNMTGEQIKLSKREINNQKIYRDRLRKIYKALEPNSTPKVPYEVSDTESPPIAFTINTETLTIPPQSTVLVDLVPLDESEIDNGVYSLEGLGKKTLHRVGDYMVCKKVARCVEICNWDKKKEWKISKGDKLALAREIKYEELPKLDDIWSTERDFILNNVNKEHVEMAKKYINKIEKKRERLCLQKRQIKNLKHFASS